MQIFICQHCGKEIIQDNVDSTKNISDMILSIGENYFGFLIEKLNTKSRKRERVYARQFIMFLLRNKTKDSAKSIGEIFNRHYSTVLHSAIQIQGFLDIQDPQACNDYEAIKKLIK